MAATAAGSRSRSRSRSRGSRSHSPKSRSRGHSRSRGRSPTRSSARLHVGKLTRNVNAGHLKEIFGHFGAVASAEVVLDRAVSLSKGFGFVDFERRADALNAVKHLDGSLVDGNTVPVALSQPREQQQQQQQRQQQPAPRHFPGNHPPGGRGPPFRRCVRRASLPSPCPRPATPVASQHHRAHAHFLLGDAQVAPSRRSAPVRAPLQPAAGALPRPFAVA